MINLFYIFFVIADTLILACWEILRRSQPTPICTHTVVMTSWHDLLPWRWEWDHVMPLSAFLVTWWWWCQECHPAPDAHSSCGCHHLRRNLVRTSTGPASISQANSELMTGNLNLYAWNTEITSFNINFPCSHCCYFWCCDYSHISWCLPTNQLHLIYCAFVLSAFIDNDKIT